MTTFLRAETTFLGGGTTFLAGRDHFFTREFPYSTQIRGLQILKGFPYLFQLFGRADSVGFYITFVTLFNRIFPNCALRIGPYRRRSSPYREISALEGEHLRSWYNVNFDNY